MLEDSTSIHSIHPRICFSVVERLAVLETPPNFVFCIQIIIPNIKNLKTFLCKSVKRNETCKKCISYFFYLYWNIISHLTKLELHNNKRLYKLCSLLRLNDFFKNFAWWFVTTMGGIWGFTWQKLCSEPETHQINWYSSFWNLSPFRVIQRYPEHSTTLLISHHENVLLEFAQCKYYSGPY